MDAPVCISKLSVLRHSGRALSNCMQDSSPDVAFIEFQCPYCGADVSFPERSAHTVQECPFCSEVLVVPRDTATECAKPAIPVKMRRLTLRRLVPGDAGDLAALMADEESYQYILWEPQDIGEVEQWLEKDPGNRLTRGHSLSLGIELLDSKRVIGIVSIYFLDGDNRQMSFMVMVDRNYRRQGFGTEALLGAASLAFQSLKTHRLFVFCDTRNTAAFKMLEKADFRREAHCLKGEWVKGEWVDTFWYALLAKEF
jgi:RimJ/RimL family protein N-acetyltransferase